MGLLREIILLAIIGLATLSIPAVQAAQCSRADYKSIRTNSKGCKSGEIKVACELEFPDVIAESAVCCPLSEGRRISWFCDGEEKHLKCPAGSVNIEATATDGGVKLTCFAPKPEPVPVVDEESEDDEPAEN